MICACINPWYRLGRTRTRPRILLELIPYPTQDPNPSLTSRFGLRWVQLCLFQSLSYRYLPQRRYLCLVGKLPNSISSQYKRYVKVMRHE